MTISLIFLALALGLLFWQISLFISALSGAPTVYAKSDTIRKALRAAQLKAGQTILDLGCGNARTLIIASREFGARAIGVEISPFYYLLAKINVLLNRQKIPIYYGNIKKFAPNIKKADLIYLFLMDKLIATIAGDVIKHKKSSAKIISISFPLPSLRPAQPSRPPEFYIYE